MDSAFDSALARAPSFAGACYSALKSWGYSYEEARHEGMVELFFALKEGAKIFYPSQYIKYKLTWREIDLYRISLPDRFGVEVDVANPEELLSIDEFLELLDGVTDAQKEMLTLNNYCGYTMQEVADKLGVPVGTVKSKSSRACSILRLNQ